MLIYYILLAVYLLAINFYAIVICHYQKKAFEEDSCEKNPVRDGKLFIVGLLGGALGVFLFMLIKKYRLKNLFLMVLMPLLTALNAYLIFLIIRHNFGMGIFDDRVITEALLRRIFFRF